MSALLVLTGATLCILSGLPTLASRRGSVATALLILAGAGTGFAGAVLGLLTGTTEVSLPWQIPGGSIALRVDALSAFFAAPVFLLAGTGGLYADRYWPAARLRAGYVRTFFGIMTGSLALVMCAANTILFLALWEIMALASFFLIASEHEHAESRSASLLYIAASHVATLALFAIMTMLHTLTRTWTFAALPEGTGSLPEGRAILALAFLAFGIKAGLMPLHIWLPAAHAAAPSHVSSVMSGVAIKMGIYGLVRVLSLFDAIPSAFGTTLLVAGIVSSVLGVAFALAQHDLKRLLAYHSIENIGIIVTGLGIGVLARAHHEPLLALLGYAGALLHVWNHGLFKALLFLSAGAAIHSTHTRETDRMGGLARTMPWTAGAFLVGAVAISGLPPLNGFVSEWLLYLAGFTSIASRNHGGPVLLLTLVVPALALTGALALACFVKAFGATFLGTPRTADAAEAREAPTTMRLAMAPLVLGCLAIGLLPALVAPFLARAVDVMAPQMPMTVALDDLLRPVQTSALIIMTVLVAATTLLLLTRRRAASAVTWDCGYALPTARMQYTSSSLASGLVKLFAWAMPPVVHAPRTFSLFPTAAGFHSHVPDTVLDRALLPTLRGARWALGFARYIQHGRMQLYILYLGVTLILLLSWSAR